MEASKVAYAGKNLVSWCRFIGGIPGATCTKRCAFLLLTLT